MNHSVGGIFEIVLAARSSQIAISVPIPLQIAVDCCRQRKATYVKLAILIQHGPLDVLLNDVTAFMAVDVRCLYQCFDMV